MYRVAAARREDGRDGPAAGAVLLSPVSGCASAVAVAGIRPASRRSRRLATRTSGERSPNSRDTQCAIRESSSGWSGPLRSRFCCTGWPPKIVNCHRIQKASFAIKWRQTIYTLNHINKTQIILTNTII